MEIAGSVALVTGANRGLGQAYARALLAGGAKTVYAAARNPQSITEPGLVPVRLDVTDPASIAAAAELASDVNLVINNAGIARIGNTLTNESLDDARAEMETNYFGPLAVARAFAPVLAANGGGALVNVLSVLSWITLPETIGYSASKAAAWSLTNGLRTALAEQQTQVVGVHVGYMDTDMAAHVEGPKVDPADVVAQTLTALAQGRTEVLADELSQQVKAGLSAA
jgi:NAD(P)-dependent dehydrogenase (short-subunit alcohol dehydrogenase family)